MQVMPPKKKMEAQKRKHHPLSGCKSDNKRTKVSKQGHFRVCDLRDELPFSIDECLTWFNQYSDSSTNSPQEAFIGPVGIERLCQDIEVDPEDLVMLSLAWKLKAARMGYFMQSEWVNGMTELECDSSEKLKRKLSFLRQYLQSDVHFKSIYQFSFDFAKSPGHRNIDLEMGKAMLKLLLETRWSLLSQFLYFLEDSKYKVLNRDQWNNILEFSRTILPDLSNYDVNGAWPVMLDEFVENCKPFSMDDQADES